MVTGRLGLLGSRNISNLRNRRRGRSLTDYIEEAHVLPNLIEITQVIPHVLSQTKQLLDHLRMLFGEVGGLAEVFIQIDEKRILEAHAIHWSDMPVDQKRRCAGLLFLPWQMQLPFALSHRLQVDAQVIIKRLVRIRLVEIPVT